MKILVTGGAGFIASQIVDAYLALGHEVTVVDDLSAGKKKNIHPKAHFMAMDVRDPNLSTLFAKSGFEVVNHHAAQIDVRRSVQDPFFDASVNILGALRLLDCCRTYGIGKFIFASSGGTIYGECGARPATEKDPSRPASPYGFSKAAAETYIRFYGDMYKLPYTILRYGNVYGPRQDPHGEAGVVAIFIGKLLAEEPLTIFGGGRQERDYVYVADIVRANVQALGKGENATLNIGTGIASSVNELYEKLARIQGGAPAPVHAPERPGELARSVLDPALARQTLGWEPSYSLDKGLEETLHFFREHARRDPPKKA